MPRENMLFQTNFDGNCQKASIFAKICPQQVGSGLALQLLYYLLCSFYAQGNLIKGLVSASFRKMLSKDIVKLSMQDLTPYLLKHHNMVYFM